MQTRGDLEAIFLQKYKIKVEVITTGNSSLMVIYKGANAVDLTWFSNTGGPQMIVGDIISQIRKDIKGTKNDPIFSDIAEAVFDIVATLDSSGTYMVVEYTDRHSGKIDSEYYRYLQKGDTWVHAEASLKGISKILMANNTDTDIKVVENNYISVPKVKFADNCLEMPVTKIQSDNSNKNDVYVRVVKTLEQSSDKIIFSVEEVRLVFDTTDIKHRNSIYTVVKEAGSPISIKRKDVVIGSWWGYKLKSVIDFEKHPLNIDIHEFLADSDPKFVADSVYITSMERIWMSTKSGWVLVNSDYIIGYGKTILSESVVNEVNAYFNFKILLK